MRGASLRSPQLHQFGLTFLTNVPFAREKRMKYFFLSLCLVAFWTGGSYGEASLSISFPDSTVTATEGDKKNITCIVSGETLPEQVTWQLMANGEKEFKDVAGENYKVMPFGDVEEKPGKRVFNLTIAKLTLEMSGNKYKCVPPEDNAFTFAEKSTEIEIVVTAKASLSVTVPESTVTAAEGDTKNITCTVSGETLPKQVAWQLTAKEEKDFKNVPVDKYGVMPFEVVEGEPDKRVFILTIKNVTAAMSGHQYKCVPPQNAAYTLTKELPTVGIVVKGEDYTASLSISFPDSNVTATEGEKKSITCTVSGKTLPEQVTWQIKAKGEEEFKDVAGENYDAMPFGDVEGQPEKRVFNLTITKLTLEMSGDKYRCVPPEGTDFTFAKKSTEIEIVVTAKDETSNSGNGNDGQGEGHVGTIAFAIAVVVLLVLCGAVSLVYWKRQTLRDWFMDKDVKKHRWGKGYNYNKLPRDISTSMKQA